jgi:hypothetical protein
MITRVKRTVSVTRDIDDAINEAATALGKSYSGVMSALIEDSLRRNGALPEPVWPWASKRERERELTP